MYDKKYSHSILEKLRNRISEFSEKQGFHPATKKNWTGKYIEDTWENSNNWQKKEIRTLFMPFDSGFDIVLSLYLFMEGDRAILFDGQTLGYLIHKKYHRYKLPSKLFGILLKKRINFFLNRIEKDIFQQFGWFSDHNTPKKCIDILLKEKQQGKQNRNGFGMKFSDEAIQFLKSVKGKA